MSPLGLLQISDSTIWDISAILSTPSATGNHSNSSHRKGNVSRSRFSSLINISFSGALDSWRDNITSIASLKSNSGLMIFSR